MSNSNLIKDILKNKFNLKVVSVRKSRGVYAGYCVYLSKPIDYKKQMQLINYLYSKGLIKRYSIDGDYYYAITFHNI